MAIIGTDAFTTGFRLIGIGRTHETDTTRAQDTIQKTISDPALGILVIEEAILKGMHPEDRRKIENTVRPVVVVLSKDASAGGLRESIIRAIGVDLWKEES